MNKWLTLVPAYNRDYKHPMEVLEAWNTRKDFQIWDVSCRWNGSYVGRGDAESQEDLRGTTFKIRYNRH